MFRLTPVCLLSLLVTPLAAQNEKTFHNATHLTGAVRNAASVADTLYFVQDTQFRYGYGKGTGVRLTLQDSDQSTAEQVTIGFTKVVAGLPSTSPLGTASASVFGIGTGLGSAIVTIALSNGIALPETSALVVTLPKPRAWPADATTIQYQDGQQLRLPNSVQRQQWTYVLDASNNVALAFQNPGTTLAAGGLYEQAVLGLFNRSTAYGSPENLVGPEALYHDSARGDLFGYYINAAAFKGEWAIVIYSGAIVTPYSAPPLGTILLSAVGAVALQAPVPLDSKGSATTGTVKVPPGGFTVWSQAVLVDLTNNLLATTDACGTTTK